MGDTTSPLALLFRLVMAILVKCVEGKVAVNLEELMKVSR